MCGTCVVLSFAGTRSFHHSFARRERLTRSVLRPARPWRPDVLRAVVPPRRRAVLPQRGPRAVRRRPVRVPHLHARLPRASRPLPHGRAAQVDPMNPTLKAPGTKRLKLKNDELLSNFGFKFNLRRYIMAGEVPQWAGPTTRSLLCQLN